MVANATMVCDDDNGEECLFGEVPSYIAATTFTLRLASLFFLVTFARLIYRYWT